MYVPRQSLHQKRLALNVLKEAWCLCERNKRRMMDVLNAGESVFIRTDRIQSDRMCG